MFALAECGCGLLKYEVCELPERLACSERTGSVQHTRDRFFFCDFNLARIYTNAAAFKSQMFDCPGKQRTRLLNLRRRSVWRHDQRKKFLQRARYVAAAPDRRDQSRHNFRRLDFLSLRIAEKRNRIVAGI